jgi:hypothetical protein
MLTQLVDANEVPLRTLTVGALNVMRNLDWPETFRSCRTS